MPDRTGRGSAPFESERPAGRSSDACAGDDVLGRVLHVISNDAPEADVVADALDELVSALGLSRASLAIVRDVGDVRRLDPIAAAGEHASFARDMPAVPLEQMAEAAIVVTERRGLYVEDVHGLGERTADADTGVGRWRSGMSTQAHAVLPVIARGSVVGVLTVQWSTPQAFTAEERHSLEAVALLFGLILERAAEPEPPERGAEEGSAGGGAEGSSASDIESSDLGGVAEPQEAQATIEDLPAGLEILDYAVNAGGAVLPWSPGTSAEAVLKVTVPCAQATKVSAPFWDVVGAGADSILIVAGTAQATRGGADVLASTASRELRTALLSGSTPASALSALNAWLLRAGPGNAWISAACWRLDPTTGALSAASAGSVVTASLGRDGREAVSSSRIPALGAVARVSLRDSIALVLPGDVLAVCAGSVAWADSDPGRRALVGLLSRVAVADTEPVAARLLGATTDESIVPAVVLVRFARG